VKTFIVYIIVIFSMRFTVRGCNGVEGSDFRLENKGTATEKAARNHHMGCRLVIVKRTP